MVLFTDKFHPNQKTTGNEIIKAYLVVNYVLLYAEVQVGKTATALWAAFNMMVTKKINNVIIMSGASDLKLQKQWQEKINGFARQFARIYSANINESREHEDTLEEMLKDNITIIFRTKMYKKMKHLKDNCLIIWDESHYATTEKQTIHNICEENGLMDSIQGDTSYIRERNIYVLSVTATRSTEQTKKEHSQIDAWKEVILSPGIGYKGIEYYLKNGLIHSMEKFEKTMTCSVNEKITQFFDTHLPQGKYIIIRAQSKVEEQLRDFLYTNYPDDDEYDIVKFNSQEEDKSHILDKYDIDCIEDLFDIKPEKTTIVLLRGLMRMGCNLNTTYISAIWETSKKPKHDTVIQALPGRICGYNNNPHDIHIYATGPIEPYEEYVDYSKGKCGLSNTQGIYACGKFSTGRPIVCDRTNTIIANPKCQPTKGKDIHHCKRLH